ncbi:MAG: sensor histidine kinase [Lachnospiraceae bacterium]
MKYSIRRQVTIIGMCLMIFIIGLCWILNNLFLEKYYLEQKKSVLLESYNVLNEAVSAGEITTAKFDQELQEICNRYNINVLVIDMNSSIIQSSGNDSENAKIQLWDNMFLRRSDNDLILDTSQYKMQIIKDPRSEQENLELWGVLDNGNSFMIRTALQSIKDSVKISNQFLAYIALFATILSGLIAWVVSKKFTKPILELASISQSVAKLDFSVKYQGNSKTEIALLGENINTMSESLKNTISELKTVNNELLKDIQRKTKEEQMRKEFLSDVSHELKTPIALIQGYAEGLKDGINEDEESKEFYCSVIIDEASKMNQMVKKLLTLNHLEYGTDVVAMERFDLVVLIKNYLQTAEILLKQQNISLRHHTEEPIYVWGDEFKVEEVFMNYFTNAINHCAKEKVIDIKYEHFDGKVRVVVFNTGENIPEESLCHVWDKFYKVDKARTRAYGGSGIGLSIVKAIMETMNQKFGVDNYDNGVAFWFELEEVECNS